MSNRAEIPDLELEHDLCMICGGKKLIFVVFGEKKLFYCGKTCFGRKIHFCFWRETLLAGKIVSVEARHAGYIRELVMLNSFADRSVVDIAGLDVMKTPHDVLTAVKPFIKTSIDFSKLPN